MKTLIEYILFGGSSGVCIGLFQTGHIFWAFFLAAALVSFGCGKIIRNINNELSWMSIAIVDPSELKEIKEE